MHTKTSLFFSAKLTGGTFRVLLLSPDDTDDAQATEIDVTDGIDYEREFPKSRFVVEIVGIGK